MSNSEVFKDYEVVKFETLRYTTKLVATSKEDAINRARDLPDRDLLEDYDYYEDEYYVSGVEPHALDC